RWGAVAGTVAGGVAIGAAAVLVGLIQGRGAGGGAGPAPWSIYGWLLLPWAAGWVTALLFAGMAQPLARAAQPPGDAASGESPPAVVAREPTAVIGLLLLIALVAAAYRAPAGALLGLKAQPTLAGYGLALGALGFLLAAPFFLGAHRSPLPGLF